MRNTSESLASLVEKSTTWSRPQLSAAWSTTSLISRLLLQLVMELVDQSMSRRLLSPPIQMTSLVCFFAKFPIAVVKWAAYSVSLFVGL